MTRYHSMLPANHKSSFEKQPVSVESYVEQRKPNQINVLHTIHTVVTSITMDTDPEVALTLCSRALCLERWHVPMVSALNLCKHT